MTRIEDTDAMLDGLFAQARRDDLAQPPSQALLARVMADARAEQALCGVVSRADLPLTAPVRRGIWAGFLAGIGGPRAFGGLITAGLAGIWIGVSGGAQVASYFGVSTGSAVEVLGSVDLMPVEDVFAMVGGIGG